MPNELDELKIKIQHLERLVNNLVRLDRYYFGKIIQIQDGTNIQVGLTTGMEIGTATTQKISVYGVTPVVQAGAIASPSADTTSLKTAVDAIRTALTNFGITA